MVQELTVPVDYSAAREALTLRCLSPKRSQIDDALYRRADGVLARLRRQDTVTRLSCTRPDVIAMNPPETIVLDLNATRRLLELLEFEAADRVRFVRETWRSCRYLLHLDRVEDLGDYITVQSEHGAYPLKTYRKLALKQLKSMGIKLREDEPDPVKDRASNGVDSPKDLPYTASITRAASAPS